ncbi:TPA: phage virion morphogenesis protein [Escherichia coli]
MRQETRFKFNAYLSRVAELNGIDAGDVSKKFTVEPSVTQTLMNTMQESSDFLTRINIVPVSEMKGEKIGIGVTGSIASTTDTAGGTERQPKDFSKLASNKYECDQINFDFYIRYKTLDLWARYQDFQLRVRNAIIKRQSLDLIMAGFNGVRRAETSDRSSNPMLQDVAVGWLQKYRNEAPARVMSKVTDEEGRATSEVIRVGKGGDYASLDALVTGLIESLSPSGRRRLSAELAKRLRQSQQRRVMAQKAPDGTPYAPRQQQSARKKTGRVKRKMFAKLITSRFLHIRASPEQASMEFYGGKSPKIASVHQFGLSEENRKDGKKIDYPARPLLGFTGEDVQMIEEIILAHLER